MLNNFLFFLPMGDTRHINSNREIEILKYVNVYLPLHVTYGS